MTSYTARALTTDKLQKVITQALHGFVVGDVLLFNGAAYAKAQANSVITAQTVGMVSFVIDANNFVLTQAGHISNIANGSILVAGALSYLDEVNPGRVTIVAPTAVGQVVVPLIIADTATSGWYFNNAGTEIEGASTVIWQTIIADQTLAVNNGYFCNGAAQLQLLLPAVSSVGDEIKVVSLNAFGFSINQGALQSMQFLGGSTLVGGAGSAASNVPGEVVNIVCDVPNLHWVDVGIAGPSLLIT